MPLTTGSEPSLATYKKFYNMFKKMFSGGATSAEVSKKAKATKGDTSVINKALRGAKADYTSGKSTYATMNTKAQANRASSKGGRSAADVVANKQKKLAQSGATLSKKAADKVAAKDADMVVTKKAGTPGRTAPSSMKTPVAKPKRKPSGPTTRGSNKLKRKTVDIAKPTPRPKAPEKKVDIATPKPRPSKAAAAAALKKKMEALTSSKPKVKSMDQAKRESYKKPSVKKKTEAPKVVKKKKANPGGTNKAAKPTLPAGVLRKFSGTLKSGEAVRNINGKSYVVKKKKK